MSLGDIVLVTDKNKKSKSPIIHYRVREGETYPAIFTDCNMHKENILKLNLIVYPVAEGIQKEFFFNLKYSSYRLDNILDMLNIESNDLTELIGKTAIIKIERRERYEDLIVVKEISKDVFCEEIGKLEDYNEPSGQKKERRTPDGRKWVSPIRKNASKSSERKVNVEYEYEDTDVEEDDDIDFSDEE